MVAPPTEEMIAVVAEAQTGIPWDQLTEEQKAAIYRDYEGEQEVLYAAYEQAVAEQETETLLDNPSDIAELLLGGFEGLDNLPDIEIRDEWNQIFGE